MRLHADMTGRVALVTGASAGIGQATAVALARCGARVFLVGRNRERLSATQTLVRDAGGVAELRCADLASDEAAHEVIQQVIHTFGRLDCLVHNAGVFEFASFEDTPVESLDAQYRTNLRAPYLLTQTALPHLGEGSTVVFVGSNVVSVGFPQTAAYTATKGGLEAMARALAVELAPRGIRINVVSPGMTRTQMTSRLEADPAYEAAAIAKTPVGRLGTVDDIADAVLYCASPASGYILGAVLTVDGGFSAI